MNNIYGQELLENMHGLLRLHLLLKDAAERKKAVLIKGDINELQSMVEEEAQLLREISDEEGKRIKVVITITNAVKGQNTEALSFDEILPFLSESESQQLKVAKSELVQVISQLREINKVNEDLIKVSLNYVEYMINTIAETGEGIQVYTPNVQSDEKQTREGHFINWKA